MFQTSQIANWQKRMPDDLKHRHRTRQQELSSIPSGSLGWYNHFGGALNKFEDMHILQPSNPTSRFVLESNFCMLKMADTYTNTMCYTALYCWLMTRNYTGTQKYTTFLQRNTLYLWKIEWNGLTQMILKSTIYWEWKVVWRLWTIYCYFY